MFQKEKQKTASKRFTLLLKELQLPVRTVDPVPQFSSTASLPAGAQGAELNTPVGTSASTDQAAPDRNKTGGDEPQVRDTDSQPRALTA
jgi:hypothetical protein